MPIGLIMKDYLKKRLSENTTRIALLSALSSLLVAFNILTADQAVSVTGVLGVIIAGTPDKQHDSPNP